MASLTVRSESVKPTATRMNTRALLKRSVGLNRAAQILADTVRCREGHAPMSLKDLPAQDATFFRQAAQQVVETYETIVYEREPSEALERAAHEREAAILITREISRTRTKTRGHDLGTFHRESKDTFHEVAECTRCGRTVRISVRHNPLLDVMAEGDAIKEGCLTVAGTTGE